MEDELFKYKGKIEKEFSDSDMSLIYFQPRFLRDFVLIVEKTKFHLHKQILAQLSAYFSNLFSEDTELSEIEMPSTFKYTVSQMEHFMAHIYRFQDEIDNKNVQSLIELSHYFGVESILKNCETFLQKVFPDMPMVSTVENIMFAQRYHLKSYLEHLVQHWCNKRMGSISKLKENPTFYSHWKHMNIYTLNKMVEALTKPKFTPGQPVWINYLEQSKNTIYPGEIMKVKEDERTYKVRFEKEQFTFVAEAQESWMLPRYPS